MRIGHVNITLQRTIRIPNGRTPATLPPGLGALPVYKVSDYRASCPELWEDDGVFVPMHDREATWLSFHLVGTNPRALLIGAGNVNAITGQKLTNKLQSPQNYVVVPPQPWLDGWKDTDDIIYQFCATEYKGGEGLTVGEQILGEESNTGGIGIAVYAPKDKDLSTHKPFHEFPVKGAYDQALWDSGASWGKVSYAAAATLSVDVPKVASRSAFTEMGLGKAGRITQKVYPDPHGLDAWEDEPEAVMAIYLVNAKSFEEITGLKAPELPPSIQQYQGPYFQLPDQQMEDTEGSTVFAGLSSVFVDDTPSQVDAQSQEVQSES